MTVGHGEPTFYLNDLAGNANVDVSGVKSIQEMDERPITTYLPTGTINSLSAENVQKWFQFKGGKADDNVYDSTYDGDLMLGVKSVTNTAFTNIPFEAENNTTLRFHHYNLQDDYLGTLSNSVFGSREGANLFENVPELKAAYNTALIEATNSSNALMNDISSTIVSGVDVSKKLAKTIMTKYPERYELKFGAKLGVNGNIPNGHLGYDTSKPTGKQTTADWVVYNATAFADSRDISHAEVSVTLSDQNTIDDIVMTKQGDGYKFGDELYLVKSVAFTTAEYQFIKYASILDVQANTFNHSVNLEDVLYSAELQNDYERYHENASLTFRLFLPGSTTDASVVQRTIPDNVIVGYGAAVDVSCNAGAQFQQMTVTTRGYGYATGNNLEVFKNNAKINHILTAEDAKKLNLGVLTVSKASITSDPVYNHDASGTVAITGNGSGLGGVVRVSTFDNNGTEVKQILVTGTGYGYVKDDVIQITNIANTLQTVDLSLTQFGANLLNGLIELDLSSGSPSIDTKSMRTTDGGVPAKVIAKATNGAVIELDVANNGTVVNSITVRDGVTGAAVIVGDTLTFTNDNQSAEHIVLDATFTDASFVEALNKGEEYVLDSSAALTAALTGGVYFDNATTTDITGNVAGIGATIKVTTTLSADGNGVEKIRKLEVLAKGSGYAANETITITNNYQTITKVLTLEDAQLLNGYKELIGNNYDYTNSDNKVGNANNNRKITTPPIFTDGAFGDAVGLDSSGAVIRVDTLDISDTVIESLTVRNTGSAYAGTGDLTITNPQDTRQRITLTVNATATDNSEIDIHELNNTANKVLGIHTTDIPFLFYGGKSSPVQAVKNGVDNHFSEAVVTITCDGNQSLGEENRGAVLQSITLISAAKPGTDNTDKLYYEKGDTVTFTVDQSGNQQDFVDTQQNTFSTATIVYRITIASLTQEQADVLNGKHVGTNVPLLPGDILVLMSTITSPANVEGQEQFSQSFLTQYQLI
jgi:hypothetical protein